MKKIFSVLLFLVVICQIRAEDTNITTMRKMTQRLFPQQASFFDCSGYRKLRCRFRGIALRHNIREKRDCF